MKDVICLIALKCEAKTIRSLILVNKRFCKILNSKEFLQSKIDYEFPGIRKEWRNKDFYLELKKQISLSPYLPIIRSDNNYIILHEMFRRGVYKDICLNNEIIYGICNDIKTFQMLFEILYSYIDGDFLSHKPDTISWPQYYSETITNLHILKTGF
jgi:hypothetical protein